MRNKLEELPFEEGKLFMVENYLEAVGMMTPAYDLLGQAAVKSGARGEQANSGIGEQVRNGDESYASTNQGIICGKKAIRNDIKNPQVNFGG